MRYELLDNSDIFLTSLSLTLCMYVCLYVYEKIQPHHQSTTSLPGSLLFCLWLHLIKSLLHFRLQVAVAECFGESQGERLTTWSLKLRDAHWWSKWVYYDELFHTKSNRLQSKPKTSSYVATRFTDLSLGSLFNLIIVFANDKPGLDNHINHNISQQWLYI